MISCSCDLDGDYAWYIHPPLVGRSDLSRACSCKSCGERIEPESVCSIAYRHRPPRDDVEANIHGEDGEIYIAPYRYCLDCGSAFRFIFDMNGCCEYDENMFNQLEDFVVSGGCDDEEKLYQSVLIGFSGWLFTDESTLLDYDLCIDKCRKNSIPPQADRFAYFLQITFMEAKKVIDYGAEQGLIKLEKYRASWLI